MIINILCSCQSSSLRILRSFRSKKSLTRCCRYRLKTSVCGLNGLEPSTKLLMKIFLRKIFKPFAPSAYPLRPLTNHCAGRCPARCFVGGLKWTRTIDWKVKRFSTKISKAFDIVAVDVRPLSRNNLSNATSLRLLNYWWAQMDSNHRPHAYQACALTS